MFGNKSDKKASGNPDILKTIVIAIAGLFIVLLVFAVGVKVGSLKAEYSYRWAENYHKNFAGPSGGFMGDWRKFPADGFIDGHGAFGEIIELNDDEFVIRGREDVEKIVIITGETVIKDGMETMEDSLAIGDMVTVIGTSNEEGQIQAKLIRMFDDGMLLPVPRSPNRPRGSHF